MRYLTIVSLVFCLLAPSLRAAESLALYVAEVEVPSQAAEARADGMRQAMAEVLLRVSGDSRVHEDAALAEAMQQPARYVQQYRYRSEALPQPPAPGMADAAKQERLLLSVSFDSRSIDALLRQSGFNVWGSARPSTLIWLVVEDGGKRVLVGANDKGLVRGLIETEATRRALPVKLPLLDQTDLGQVRPVDVWGEFLDTIRSASQRYAPQALLVGSLYPVSAGRWEARWTLDYRGELTRWQSASGEVAPLLAGAIDRVTGQLAASFTQGLLGGNAELRMRVEGVGNLKAYRRVVDYLSGISGVKQVVVETLTPTAVTLRISAEGGPESVLRVIALGKTLARLEQPQTPQANGTLPRTRVSLMGGSERAAGTPASADAPAAKDAAVVVEPPQPELHYRLIP